MNTYLDSFININNKIQEVEDLAAINKVVDVYNTDGVLGCGLETKLEMLQSQVLMLLSVVKDLQLKIYFLEERP